MSLLKNPIKSGWFVCICALSACTSVNEYVQPSGSEAGTLVGRSNRNGMFDWEVLSVNAVDDKYVAAPSFSGADSVRVKLTDKPHNLVVRAEFNRQFGSSGPYEAFVGIPFQPLVQGEYQLSGKVRDNVFEVWIVERHTGQVVSQVYSAPYQAQPKTQIVVAPYVPTGR